MDDYITRREHDEFVRRMEDEHERINKRLTNHDKATKELQQLVNAVGKMAVNMENMLTEIKSQGARLESLEEYENKSWNTIKNGIFNAIGATIGGAIIAAIIFFL